VQGTEYFSQSKANLLRSSALSNGWFAELNLSNDQKTKKIERLTQKVGRSHDQWSWQATNRPAPKLPPDTVAMLKAVYYTHLFEG
jgi:hypothetical protein